jgi:hypothetical protein
MGLGIGLAAQASPSVTFLICGALPSRRYDQFKRAKIARGLSKTSSNCAVRNSFSQ